MGDALAVVLLNRKKFQEKDFRQNHPGGSLGERLKVKVSEVMLVGEDIPLISPEGGGGRAIKELNEKNKGAVLVVDGDNFVLGIVTDGDIRRAVMEAISLDRITASELMTRNPICIKGTRMAADALSIMQQHEITALPITDDKGRLEGMLHLHDLLGKGEFRFLV